MGFMQTPMSWGYSVDNLEILTPGTALPGTGVTPNATANTEGTVVQVLSTLQKDLCYLQLSLGGFTATGVNHQVMVDVLIDPAGGSSWSEEIISDLVCGMTPIPTGAGMSCATTYFFPIFIRSGSSVGIRAKSQGATSPAGRCIMVGYGEPSRPENWWCGSGVETLGRTTGCQGTNVTAGNAVWGGWTNIGTSTRRYGFVQYGINGSDATAAAQGYHFQLGHGGAKLPGSPTTYRSLTTAEVGQSYGSYSPIWCNTPASTTFQIRGICNAAPEVLNACVYGVY